MVFCAVETLLESTGKGQSLPCKETGASLSSEDLQQIRLIALVGFTVLVGLRSDNWKAWLSLKWWRGHFQESLGERIPSLKGHISSLRLFLFSFLKFLKESSESLQCEMERCSHQINYSVSFKIPAGNACYAIANSHRPYTNAFSGNCLCNNKLLVGKWIGFSQAMHLIPFTLILMENFPVSLVGADPVQGCGKLCGWICLNCKVFLSASVLLNFVPPGFWWFTLRFIWTQWN